MLAEIELNCGRAPDRLTADAGYFSEKNIYRCHEHGIDAHIAVQRQRRGSIVVLTSPQESEAKRRMREKLQSAPGRAVYARRKVIVEPVFGQTKEVRGFRRFQFKGRARVRNEWSLICLGHNLGKLYRASRVGPGHDSGITVSCGRRDRKRGS